MANFTLYNKRNGECPICGDTSGKCRTKSNSPGELILCMNLAGEAKGTIIDGYKCLGDTSDGNWAKFVPDNTTEWTQQQREEWRRERELKRLKNDQEEKKRQSESLSPEERDKQYQKILDELPLHKEDRKDLTRRGFTNKQIKQCGFKSVDQWQKLQEQYPHLLPGVNIHGNGLLTQRGYLCPVKNADRLIVAIQVRLYTVGGKGEPQDKGEAQKGKGRYRWLTSKTKKRPHGQSPHVYPQGKKELPLSVHYPLAIRKRQIGICEGTGVKPFLTSQRLGMPVIGAAGGQFTSSPLTFGESLEKITRKISLNQVNKNLQKSFPNKENIELVIYPDAGDVKNPQVMRRWRKVFELLKQWQWEFTIAWWGQVEKTDPDIDELDDLGKIKHITPAEFLGISQEYLTNQGNREQRPCPAPTIGAPGSELRQGTGNSKDVDHGIKPNGRSREQNTQSIASINGLLNHSCPLPVARSLFPLSSGDNSPQKQNWLNSKKFTPDIELDQRYLNIDPSVIRLGQDLAINSGTGTGKTYWMLHKLLSLFSDMGMIGIGYRNSVLFQLSESAKSVGLNFYHLQTDLVGTKEKVLLSDPQSKILFCSDSLTHMRPEDADGKILILDEIQSIESHTLMSSTAVSYQREKVKELLHEAINRAAMVIYLDGHLTDDTLDYLNSNRKHQRKLVKIRNHYTGNKGRVKFYLGGYTQKGKFSPHNHTKLIERIKHSVDPIVVASDSQKELETLDRILTAQGGNVFRFDSTTSTSKLAKEFLRNPKEFIIRNKITHLLYSPSAEAGISVDIKGYFKEMFFLFYGVIDVDPCLQMMARVRDSEALTYVWVRTEGMDAHAYHRDALPDNLQKSVIETTAKLITKVTTEEDKQELVTLLLQQIDDARKNPHEQRAVELKALHNYEQQNLRECLYERMIASGYQVEQCQGITHDDSQRKEVKEEIALEKATRIFEADDISDAEANELKRKFGSTQEEKDQVAKARLKNRLPGIEDEVYETEEVIEKTPEQLQEELKNQYEPGSVEEYFLKDAHLNKKNLIKKVKTTHQIFTPEFIKLVLFDERNHISKLDARWRYHNLDQAKKQERIRLSKKAERMLDPDEPDCLRRISPLDFKPDYLKLDELKGQLNLDWFLEPGRTWDKNTPEVIEFWEKAKKESSLKALGKKSAGSSPVACVRECLGMLGYSTKSKRGNGLRTYSLKDDCPTDNAIYKCVSRRFEAELRSDKAKVKFKQLAKMVASKGGKSGTEEDDFNQKIKDEKLDSLSPESQSVTSLKCLHTSKDSLNNNPEGVEVNFNAKNLDSVVDVVPIEMPGNELINPGAERDDFNQKIKDKKLENLSSESQTVNTLQLSHTYQDNLNNNPGGVGKNSEAKNPDSVVDVVPVETPGNALVERFRIAVASGREFALEEAASWSCEELELVINVLPMMGDYELLEALLDPQFEQDLERFKVELGIVNQPKRQNYIEEYGLPGFVQQLANVAVHYGKHFVSSLMASLTNAERQMVLSHVEGHNPPLFAQLISWGLGSEGLSPDIPF